MTVNNRIVYIFFYPVRHKRAGLPCYVGKGVPSRIQAHLNCSRCTAKSHHHNKPFNSLLSRYNNKIPVVILHEGLSDRQAKEYETSLIVAVGRLDKDTGPLFNHTDGGDGANGQIISDETRKKLSEANKGKKASDSARKKMSLSASARVRRPCSPETAAKISAAQKGKPRATDSNLLSVTTKAAMVRPEVKIKHMLAQQARFAREDERIKLSKRTLGKHWFVDLNGKAYQDFAPRSSTDVPGRLLEKMKET
jgi:DNA-binding transcriptional ArsR family regulator